MVKSLDWRMEQVYLRGGEAILPEVLRHERGEDYGVVPSQFLQHGGMVRVVVGPLARTDQQSAGKAS